MAFFSGRSKRNLQRQTILALPLFFTFSLALVGCATQEVSNLAPPVEEQAVEETNYSLKSSVETILERPLDAETMALLLEAELSAYRGNLERSVSIYAEQAQLSQDPGIAKRYAEMALASEDAYVLLDASLLWYELDPENELAQQLAIRALATMGETEGAWEIVMLNPTNHLAVRILAAETRRSEFGPQMIWLSEQITNVYGKRPNSAELLIALSVLSEGSAMISGVEAHDLMAEAASYAAKASSLRPEMVLPIQLQANALLKLEKTDEAIQVVTDYTNEISAPKESRIQMARFLASIDQEAALPVFQDLAEEFPWAGELKLSAAQILLGLDRTEEAEEYYHSLTQMGDHRDLAHFNLGIIYELRDMPDQARDYYFLVGPGDLEFESRLRAASILSETEPQKISDEYESLLSRFPDNALTTYHEYGRALANIDEPEKAIQIFSRGLIPFPNNEALLYARSLTYESMDMIDESVADLRTVLEQDTENASALNALGYTLANRTEQYDEAYSLIDRALSLNPEDPAIIDSMGWVLHRLGRNSEALGYLERAFEAFFDAEVLFHLVEVLVALDRFDDARILLSESLEQLPDSKYIPALIMRLEELEEMDS